MTDDESRAAGEPEIDPPPSSTESDAEVDEATDAAVGATEDAAADLEAFDDAGVEALDEADEGSLDDSDERTADAAIGDDEAVEGAPVAAAASPQMAARPGARATAGPSASEVAVHIDDRISAIYVLLVIAVFIGILLYGILAGRGGVLTSPPSPSPSPAPSVVVSPSA